MSLNKSEILILPFDIVVFIDGGNNFQSLWMVRKGEREEKIILPLILRIKRDEKW